ncbi:hypothetical protein [Streptomyces sp. NPDC002788]
MSEWSVKEPANEGAEPWGGRPGTGSSPADPKSDPPAGPGDNSVSGRDTGATGAPADGTTDKKVL